MGNGRHSSYSMLVLVLRSQLGKGAAPSFDGALLDARSNASYRTNFDSQNKTVWFQPRNLRYDSQIA